MVEFDITSASHQLADTALNGNESVTYREVRDSSLPGFIKAWFHMGVESWYAQEYAWRSDNPHFNFKAQTVQSVVEEYDRLVKETAVFTREDCLQIIESALRHEWNYLHQPVSALTELLFRNSEVVDGVHLVDFLTHFQREPYYAEAVKGYVLEHEDTRLDQELFEQFLTNAERESLQEQPTEAVKMSARAVDEIMSLVGQNGSPEHISLGVWEEFVSARGFDRSVPDLGALITSLQTRQTVSMTIDHLFEALESTSETDLQVEDISLETPVEEQEVNPTTAEDATPEDAYHPVDEALEAREQPFVDTQAHDEQVENQDISLGSDDAYLPIDEPEKTAEEPAEDALATEDQEIDLTTDDVFKPVEDDLEDELISSEPVSGFAMSTDDFIEDETEPASAFAPPEQDEYDADEAGQEDELNPVSAEAEAEDTSNTDAPDEHTIDFGEGEVTADNEGDDGLMDEAIANTATPPPQPSIQVPPVEISDKLRKMFIKKLFGKDEAAYQEVITQLEPALSWEETFSIIEEIWQERGLNLFSKESQEFTRVFYERYFPPA